MALIFLKLDYDRKQSVNLHLCRCKPFAIYKPSSPDRQIDKQIVGIAFPRTDVGLETARVS